MDKKCCNVKLCIHSCGNVLGERESKGENEWESRDKKRKTMVIQRAGEAVDEGEKEQLISSRQF